MDNINIRERMQSYAGNADVMRCAGCIYRTADKRCVNIHVDNPDWYQGGGCSAGKWLVVHPHGEQIMSWEGCWPLFAERGERRGAND